MIPPSVFLGQQELFFFAFRDENDFNVLCSAFQHVETSNTTRRKEIFFEQAVFGQIKFDLHYRRFRHKGKDKVYMEFAIISMAHNLRKLMRKTQNELMERVFSYLLRLCKPDCPIQFIEPNNRIYKIAA